MYCASIFLFISLLLVVLSLHSCEQAFSGCGYSGLLSHCGAWTSHCSCSSYCRAEALVGFSDCSTWDQYLWLRGPRPCRLQSLWQEGLVAPWDVRSSWTGDQTHVPCTGRWILFFFFLIFISWRLIPLQYCSGFCHTLT